MKMIERRYTVRFLSPAFLGDAEQNARWRTPPFKAQLRQWWRVAYAAERNFNVDLPSMRSEEGRLFGHAWLENDTFERDERTVTTAARKSLVRLRLNRWDYGNLKKSHWPADAQVTHPEVKNRDGKLIPVGSALYLGYGPLIFDNRNRSTSMKSNAAIQAGEQAEFSLASPDAMAATVEKMLWLMHRYGTVGGRSRNGWGSYELSPPPGAEGQGMNIPLRPWRDCLDRDWPHAIGEDDKGALIWQTAPHDDWKALMKTLAIIKIGLRTQFAFTTGKNAPRTEDRHWLSYPVTNHSVAAWGNNLRLPNQLRFKVRRTKDGRLVGVIFHLPHLPPAAFHPNRRAIEAVWAQVHRFLDNPAQKLQRIPE